MFKYFSYLFPADLVIPDFLRRNVFAFLFNPHAFFIRVIGIVEKIIFINIEKIIYIYTCLYKNSAHLYKL